MKHHKQLKTMEIIKTWPDTYDEEYMRLFQLAAAEALGF